MAYANIDDLTAAGTLAGTELVEVQKSGVNKQTTAQDIANLAPGVSAIDDLTDVDTSSTAPTDGQALVWDDTSSLWLPGTVAAGSSSAVGARAYRSGTNQTLSNGTVTAISLNAENWDTDNLHSNSTNPSRLTIPTGMGGKWLAVGAIQYASNTSGIRMARIHVNGTETSTRTYLPITGGFPTVCGVSDVLTLTAGQYLELHGYQTSGGNLDVAFASSSTFLAALFMGA